VMFNNSNNQVLYDAIEVAVGDLPARSSAGSVASMSGCAMSGNTSLTLAMVPAHDLSGTDAAPRHHQNAQATRAPPWENLDFHKLAGQRVKYLREEVITPQAWCRSVVWSYAAITSGALTGWLKSSHPYRLQDVLWPQRCPFVAVLQFLSALLCQDPGCGDSNSILILNT